MMNQPPLHLCEPQFSNGKEGRDAIIYIREALSLNIRFGGHQAPKKLLHVIRVQVITFKLMSRSKPGVE